MPHTRIGSFLIGATYAWFRYAKLLPSKLSSFDERLMNVVMCIIGLGIFCYPLNYSLFTDSVFNALSRPLVSVVIVMVVHMCESGSSGNVKSFLEHPV